jgi:hypothetical protein
MVAILYFQSMLAPMVASCIRTIYPTPFVSWRHAGLRIRKMPHNQYHEAALAVKRNFAGFCIFYISASLFVAVSISDVLSTDHSSFDPDV